MAKVTVSMSNRFRNLPDPTLIHVATLGRTVGLKGDMKLNLFTDFPEQFAKNTTFTLENGSTITILNYNPDRELVHILGYDTPEAAKALTNAKLFTTYEATRERCNLAEGEHFWFDLIGLHVFEGDLALGTVLEIERIGPLDYLLVKTDSLLVNKDLPATFLIPYIDRFVLNADIEMKKIMVEGGLDLLEAS
ncbi:MAG TPA: ribosome maturation factor RimM [Sulfuricurvum sp.]|nr:ribosome maturation factor RimM [Sulfuricurvum sp.]